MTNPNNPDSGPAVVYLVQRADLELVELRNRVDDLQAASDELRAADQATDPVRYANALDRFTAVLYRGTGVDQQVNRSLTREGAR